jgi:hypothetical protein
MRRSTRASILAVSTVAVAMAVSLHGQTVKSAAFPFSAAHFQLGFGRATNPQLVVFPASGPSSHLDLPEKLGGNFRLLGSSSDGRAVYGQLTFPKAWGGITKIEFDPIRLSVVSGSVGLGNISSLIESPQSGRILVSASTMRNGNLECGDFEIDPAGGRFESLRIGAFPDCGGPVSPDGTRELTTAKDQLRLLDFRTKTARVVRTKCSWAAWSPDGRWIAAAIGEKGKSRVVLIDTVDPSKERTLATGEGPLVWSPDSKWLLLPKSQTSCLFSLFGESLQILSVDTGRKTVIPGSHCQIIGDIAAWISSDLVR